MARLSRRVGSLPAALVWFAAAAWGGAAVAQVIVDPSIGGTKTDKTGRPAKQPNFTSRSVAPWPRLDPGAVFCDSRSDLEAHHRAIQARLDGTQVAPLGSVNCRIVSAPVAIDILTRAAPSATEIRVKGLDATGWTDSWLPSSAPPR